MRLHDEEIKSAVEFERDPEPTNVSSEVTVASSNDEDDSVVDSEHLFESVSRGGGEEGKNSPHKISADD